MAARDGLLATFMGKPFNDDEGSGLHLHVSFDDGDGNNICDDPDQPHGLHPLARHFLAGVLEHGPGMMVFFNPTVNAYRRISAEALVPTRLCWGHDHRMTLIRVPAERGSATRLEIRLGDGTANPYLAYTAALAAGLDGIRRELEPPDPLEGMIYDLPEEQLGRPAADHLPGGARGAQGRHGPDRGDGLRARRHVRDDQDVRARAVPRLGHRLGVRGVLAAAVGAAVGVRGRLVIIDAGCARPLRGLRLPG